MALNFQERGLWLARNVLPHECAIRASLRRTCGKDIDIDDVIQEMYTRILSVPSLEAIRSPRQYAIQTAKSIVIDHMRRSRIVSISLCGSLDQLDIPDPDVTAEEHLEFQDEIQEVMAALAQLPRRPRETLILRRIEKLSARETAQRLGISERTVEDHMERAVCMLMEVFGRGGRKSSVRSSKVREVAGAKDEPFEPRNR